MEEEARMSWRGSGNFRGSGSSKSSGRSSGAGGSVFSGGSAGGPPLTILIGAAVALGVIALLIAIVGGAARGGAPAAAPAAPVAAPAPTAAAAAPAPTAAAAAPAAAGGAAIPTAPFGPAVATGSGEALADESQGDTPLYANATLNATAGKVYTLTFKNTGIAVLHNWVLVNGGDSVAKTVNDGAAANAAKARKPEAALPAADAAGLLVASPQVKAGESATISFTAPAAGTYTFFCTFPGHYAQGMKGQLVVK
jgi:uncharacterized cupredoxin-like copper-binding protein